MKLKLWLLLAFSLTCINASAKLLPLSKWVDSFKGEGVNIFYSSDYISENILDTTIDLQSLDVSLLNTELKILGLKLQRVDLSIYVIQPLEKISIPTTGLIVQVRDAKQQNKLKIIKARLSTGELLSFSDGYITFYNIDSQTQSVIISSVGYFPKKVSLHLEKGNYQSITVDLSKKPLALDKVIVTASRFNISNPNASKTSILREDIEHAVLINNDPLRSVSDLAGNSNTGLSGKYRTRGGHENESLILFDDYILRNPYHFNHFFSLYSTINQSVVDGLDFYSGVFPVQYGGRLSSVLSAQSGDNVNKPTHEIGVDFVSAYYTFRNNNTDYSRQSLVSLRTSLNLVDERIVEEGYLEPEVHDLYLKFSQDLNENWQSSQHLLLANDDIGFEVRDADNPDDVEQADSKHRDLNMWAQWHYQNDRTSRNIQLYYNNSSKKRAGKVLNSHSDSSLYETTKGSFYGLKFDQTSNVMDSLSLSYGLDLFREETTIGSSRNIRHFGDLIEQLELDKDFRRHFDFKNSGMGLSVFFNSRYQLNEKIIFDLGFHYEHKDWIEHDVKSPRINLSYFYDDDTIFRFAFGRHQQSQYIDEVYLEDEKIEYHDLTSADMAVVEFNKTFDNDINLRIEVYKKEYSQTQPYFENIFNELHILPDLFFDRVEIQPDDSYAIGAEFTLRGQYRSVQWLANYTYSDVEDETDGDYHPRSWNQPHALKFSAHMPIKSWFLNVSSNYHSGWPRTSLVLTNTGYQLGPRNEETYKGHLEIDVKITKNFKLFNGLARFSFQVNNLTNSFNTCCIDYSLDNNELIQDEKQWLPFTPNASLIYQWD